MAKVNNSTQSSQPQVNLGDARNITDYAKKNLDHGEFDTDHGKDTQDSFNKVLNAPTQKNATNFVHQLSYAAATEHGSALSGDDAQKVKDAAVAALHGAGVSDDNINKAISDGFVSKPDTSFNPG